MVDNRLQIRIDPDMKAWLYDRADRMHTGSADLQAKRELGMWRTVLDGELARIRLTVAQLSCLADIMNATAMDDILGPILFAEASDAFAIARDTPVPDLSSYAEKWGIDEDALLQWLGRLSPVADHALRDALSRWWEQGCEPTVEGFAKVGLKAVEPQKPAS